MVVKENFMIHMRWHHIRKRWYWIVLTIVLTMALCIGIFQGRFFFSIAQKFQDGFVLMTEKPANDVFIIKIDDKSLEKLGVFPWPRSYHADMITLLDQAKPKVIGYDVAFFESSNNPEEDSLLSKTLENTATTVVLPQELHQISNGTAASQSMPLVSLLGKNVVTGFINIFPDQDLFTRHFSPLLAFNSKQIASFATVIAAQTKKTIFPVADPDHYLGVYDPNLYPSFSFVDILEGKITSEVFRDKIVLVGSTAATLHDEVLIPYQSSTVPGVYLHALYLDGILSGHTFEEIPSAVTFAIILFLIVLIFSTKLFLPAKLDWAISIIVLALITLLPFLLIRASLVTPLFYLYITWLIAIIVSSILKIMLIEREREQLKNHFELYVNKSVVNELMKNPNKAVLGGDKREMSVLFSDIRGFTSISEQMSPPEVVQFLNEYLDMMTEIVLAQGGVLDKYIGDAIMAFWGAPLPQEDHALRGVRTAWQMQQTMKTKGADVLRHWPQLGKLKIGIGLNTGPMAVGNMGSHSRFDYTVIGDNVNIAARIEGLTKYWHADILFPESTKVLVEHEFLCRELDLVKVKGRSEPLRLFDVLAEKNNASTSLKAALLLFENGIGHYRSSQFEKAMIEFRAWKKAMPEDTVVDVFLERCEDFLAHPEKAKDFTGVIIMEGK